jgi:hypothetical protein
VAVLVAVVEPAWVVAEAAGLLLAVAERVGDDVARGEATGEDGADVGLCLAVAEPVGDFTVVGAAVADGPGLAVVAGLVESVAALLVALALGDVAGAGVDELGEVFVAAGALVPLVGAGEALGALFTLSDSAASFALTSLPLA